MVRENLNPDVAIIGILPTMFDKRVTHSREADEILRENFGELVYNTRIRKTIRYAEAPVKGASIIAYDPTARRRSCTATWRRRCSMARKRVSMREGPLAELFRATEAAQTPAPEPRRPRSATPSRADRVRDRAAARAVESRRAAGRRSTSRRRPSRRRSRPRSGATSSPSEPERARRPLARAAARDPGAPRARRARARRTPP